MKKSILLFIIGIGLSLWGWGQTTVSFTNMGTITCPASPVATISPSVTGLTFSQISRGSGVTCVSANSGISGSSFNTTLANAITGNKWYVFSVSSDATVNFSIASLSIVSQVSSVSGSPSVSVQYKIGTGALTSIGSFTPTTSSNNYTITPGSPISVNASESIYIYIIPNNLTASGTTCRVNNNTSITLSTSLVGNTSPFLSSSTSASITNTTATLGATITSVTSHIV